MAAKDIFHNIVKIALTKDEWLITNDPLHLRLSGVIDLYIDLGAEKLIAAEKNNQKIAVEIKSFVGTSKISEFHTAIGQFINYRYALENIEPDRSLYLAIPQEVYQEFFTINFIQSVLQKSDIKLLIYDIVKEEIAEWIR